MSILILSTVYDAMNLFSNNGQISLASKIIPNLKTALRKYVLPEMPGYKFDSKDLQGKNLNFGLAQITIEDFLSCKPLEILAKSCQGATERGEISQRTERTTYRPALTFFLAWIEKQEFATEIVPIEEQKYNPKREYGKCLDKDNRGRKACKISPYSLKKIEITPQLNKQIEQLHIFCTGEYIAYRQDPKMREITFEGHRSRTLLFLGWLKNIECHQIDTLELEKILDLELLNQFLSWGINQRKNTCGWATGFCDLALNVAKYLYCKDSKRPKYRDISIIEEIRMINNKLNQQYLIEKKAAKRIKRIEREMTLEQCQEVVKYLRMFTNPMTLYGRKRSEMTIARSWLRYLLVALFTYCPVRQREVRELELGRTLHRTANSYQMILAPDDNKTGDERSFLLSDILPVQVLKDLEIWLDVWRPKLKNATENLDNWLQFIGRKEYKTLLQLENFAAELRAQIQEAKCNNQVEKIEELNELLESVQLNKETQVNANKKFPKNLVFFSLGDNCHRTYGEPLEADALFSIVKRAVYTASAGLATIEHPLFKGIEPRRTNPHYFRNIATTHERRYGDPSKRKAFHKMLGNSESIGDKDYNEMHPEEKTVEAKDWWKTGSAKGSDSNWNNILKLIPKLTEQERAQLKKLIE